MSEDVKTISNVTKNDIQQLVLNHINEVLLSMGQKTNNCNKIEIPNNFIIPFTHEIESLNLLFNVTYPDFRTFYSNSSFITFRIILTIKNDFVDEINDMLIHGFPDDATCQFEDFLHTLHPTNLPPYRLTLKKNCPVILLRNLNPTESLCKGTRLIYHDFKSHVISATISGGDFKNKHYADKIKLINTYLISTAKVKVSPTSYGKPIHKFYWILDKETVIEHIKPSSELEKPLPPPTKLNITTFDRIPHMMVDFAATEIDILAIVLRCGPQKYAGRSHHKCGEITLCDNQAKENKGMLLSCASQKTSTSSSVPPMIVTPAGQQVIFIAEMSSTASMGLFYVEAEMAISNEFQEFCVLECSGCKQKKRTKDRKAFECPKCNRKTTLCIFQIDLIDGTATTTTSISAELGEKLLSMTAEDKFDITCAKLRKSSWGSSNSTHATLSILSYMEKEHTPQSTTDRNSKKIRHLEISEVEVMATTTTAGSSNATLKFEPPTPTKK
ncbi:hypothetical protein H5410_006185, partial [Solanum commersonii]